MRKIQTRDLFSACRIMEQSGLKEKLTESLLRVDKKDVSKVGIVGFLEILGAFSDEKIEKAVYKWLAPIAERTEEEIQNADLVQISEILTQLAQENNLQIFFQALFGLMRKQS